MKYFVLFKICSSKSGNVGLKIHPIQMALVQKGWLQFDWANNSKVPQQPSGSRSSVSRFQHPPHRPDVTHADHFRCHSGWPLPCGGNPAFSNLYAHFHLWEALHFIFWYLFWDLICVLLVETRSVWSQIHSTCFCSLIRRSQSTVMGRCGGAEQLPHSQSESRKNFCIHSDFSSFSPSSSSGHPAHDDSTTHIQRGSFSIFS